MSSLSRKDTYANIIVTPSLYQGNCEIFYVNKIIHNGKTTSATSNEIREENACKNYRLEDLQFRIPEFKNNNQKMIFFQ